MNSKNKIIVVICAFLICVSFISCSAIEKATLAHEADVTLYFADKDMLHLVPEDMAIKGKNRQDIANKVLAELIKGRDANKKILRVVPNVKNGTDVKVINNVAYVDFSNEFVKNVNGGAEQEILCIYSIVNSLVSIDGITKVKFSIDGKNSNEFKGHIDFSETFIFDPSI